MSIGAGSSFGGALNSFALPKIFLSAVSVALSISVALSAFLSVANAEDISIDSGGSGLNDSLDIALHVSEDVWPCFPNHFFLGSRSLTDQFGLDGVSVEISDASEFLSGSDWRDLCRDLYSSVDPPVGSIVLRVVDFQHLQHPQPRALRVNLEGPLSSRVAFEIWRRIAQELESNRRYKEAYLVVSLAVVSAYEYSTMCALNPEFQEDYRIVCDFLVLREMMNDSWAAYNSFLQLRGGEIPPSGFRDAMHQSAIQAHEQFSLISPWE